MNLDIILLIQYLILILMFINIIYNIYFNQYYIEDQEIKEKNHRHIRNMNMIILNQALLLRRF